LYLISSLAQGGGERHLVDLSRRLDPDRYEWDICTLTDQIHYTGELPEEQPRYRLHSRLWASPLAFVRLKRALRSCRPHLLHTYMNDANLWGRLAAGRSDLPRIITSVHLDEMPAGYRFAERRLAPWSKKIVACSSAIQRLLVDRLGVEADRVVIIPNGVDPQRFRPASSEEARAARVSFGLAPDDFVALMPARISRQKNQDLVVDALVSLKAAGELPPRFRLLLAGRISSARIAAAVRRAVERAGLGEQVRFLGSVRDMHALYAASDVMLMPSEREGSPIAAIESLASGVPALMSAPANPNQEMVDGQHGWEIPVATSGSIADALRTILKTSADERKRLGQQGREHVLRGFTLDRVAGDFMRLYDAVSPRPA
jgi:glycosyltransferase involved in cell wall biosynthesis